MGFSGVGFGLPLILEAPESKLPCGVNDFKMVLKDFGLEQGLQPLIDMGKSRKALNSLVKAFEIKLYSRLECIDEKKNDESYEVYDSFGGLLDFLKARIVYN